jgi:hypothetical protein
VVYQDKDIRADYQALFELIEDFGSRRTPTLVVGERVIPGFRPEEYEAALVASRE